MGWLFNRDKKIDSIKKEVVKLLKGGGFTYTKYDDNNTTYLEQGYNGNPDVYAIINQQVSELQRIPFYIKNIKDNTTKNQYLNNRLIYKNGYDLKGLIKKSRLESKAFVKEDYDLPLERPNKDQSWSDLFALIKTYLPLTGNAYLYLLSPNDGINAGTPQEIYILPSHLTEIVLTKDGEVDYYILNEGNNYTRFEAENIIHLKYANPNYNTNGSHLYGQSKLRAALKSLQASNDLRDLNANTIANGGVFGFISTKEPMLPEQAASLKDRLVQMDTDKKRMSNIAGSSQEVVFTKISLSTDELKPFEYLANDQKTLCNVLGWDAKLLNNDAGAKYDNFKEALKRGINSGVVPDLKIIEQAINDKLLPRFKGYENALFMFDVSELPEMQQDLEVLTKRLDTYLDNGVITRAEYREAISYAPIDNDNMEILTVSKTIQTLEDAINPLDVQERDTTME